jgi:putative oligomerization/nucleic acid binding protein
MSVNNKVIAIAVGSIAALFAISLVARFVLFSEYGLSGGWMFAALPFGGISILLLLLRLGVLNSGRRSGSTMAPWQHHIGRHGAPYAPPVPPASARLQELEQLLTSGAISQAEYASKRQQIMSTM